MQEIELKFQVPAAARDALAAAVAGPDKPKRTRLQAAYFDTAERTLAGAGFALRVRREGRRWVQTLKGAGSDGMTRAEHNVPLEVAAGDSPVANPALHATTPVGARLLALLPATPTLICLYRTDIWRRTRRIALDTGAAGGSVELAFDEGAIHGGGQRLAVCELEIELIDGSPLAVIDGAADWVHRHGLSLDTRTKAERGDLLARGVPMSPARRAGALVLAADASVTQALHAVLLDCMGQVNVNASQVASGDFAPEHLHQLRVGLRRLRTALRLFEGLAPGAAELAEGAAALFRQLGAARDADAIAQPLARALADALRSVGLDGTLLAEPPTTAVAMSDPVACVRDAAAQDLLLGLLRAVHLLASRRAAAGDGPPARPHASAVLERWHRQVKADAKRFAALDDDARHALRKRVKRLRYAVEFMASLYPRKAVGRYLKPLRALQERLGALNDVAVGIAAYRAAGRSDPKALFALGWLASQREALLAGCTPELAAFVDARRFWKK